MSSPAGEETKASRKPKPVYESDEEQSEPAPPPRKRGGKKKRSARNADLSGPLDSLQVGNVGETAGGLVNGATGLLGGIGGQALQQQGGGGGGKSDTLRLRLDLNLEIEITLKAKIHGDLELALLET